MSYSIKQLFQFSTYILVTGICFCFYLTFLTFFIVFLKITSMGQGKENGSSKTKGDNKIVSFFKNLTNTSDNPRGSSNSKIGNASVVGRRTSLENETKEYPKPHVLEQNSAWPLGGSKRNSIGSTGMGMYQNRVLSPSTPAAQFAATNLSPIMPIEAIGAFNDAPLSGTKLYSVNQGGNLSGQYLDRSTIQNLAITSQPKSISHASSLTNLSKVEGTGGYPPQPAMGISGKVGQKFIAQQVPSIQDELQYVKLRKTGQNLCDESRIKKQVSGDSIVQNPIKEEDEKENDWPPIAKPRPSLLKEHMNNSPSKKKKPIPLPRQNRRAAESKVEVIIDLENYCEIGKDALNTENEIESSFEHLEAPPKTSGVNILSEKLLIIQANHRLV